MDIIILPTAANVALAAADRIAALIARKPAAVLGVATGSSPQGIYAELARRVAAGDISFREASAFALDEYVDLPIDHPESYAAVVAREVIGPLGFDPDRVHVPDGRAEILDAATRAYDESIQDAGGVDLQILGIGLNGHLGFNEPTSSFASRTHVTKLTESSRQANTRFFPAIEDVPTHSVTQGIGTILEARELLLVAQGRNKAAPIAAALEGPLSSFIPATALQLHGNTTVILDEEAASGLRLIDHYRAAAKPARH